MEILLSPRNEIGDALNDFHILRQKRKKNNLVIPTATGETKSTKRMDQFYKWTSYVVFHLTGLVAGGQCDQIGRFLQVLGNKLYHKNSPNILMTFWAISNNATIM